MRDKLKLLLLYNSYHVRYIEGGAIIIYTLTRSAPFCVVRISLISVPKIIPRDMGVKSCLTIRRGRMPAVALPCSVATPSGRC